MKFLYGTTNKAKLELMIGVASELGFEVIGLGGMGALPTIDERGKDPLENARIKALAYRKAFGMPVFSCDTGLYFDGLPEALQPGTHVRRVNGKELSDAEMTEYYSALAEKYGELTARYKNAIYLIADDGTHYSRMDESLESEPFILTSVPHKKRVKGFPLDPLSIDITTRKYYYDLPTSYAKITVTDGLKKFFKDVFTASTQS